MPIYSIVRPFVELCFFRTGPQSLPASNLLLALTLVAHTTVGIVGFMMLMPRTDAIFAGILATVLMCVLTYGLLYLLRRDARLVQTLTALAGALTVLEMVGLPFASWLKSSHDMGLESGIPTFVVMILTGWHLTVQGNILRHAMSVPLMLGLAVSLLFFVMSVSVLQSLFPPTPLGG